MELSLKTNTQTIRPKILVIDDTLANLVAMKVLLKNTETDILTADSGNEGLALALEDNIALVLLDVNMPQMDGFEVARLLKQLDETSNIPIIFLTANNQDEDTRLEGYSSGAIDYIVKPVHPNVLLHKVEIFLNMWRINFDMEQEIKRRIAIEKEIEYLAQHDTLTHLINRRQLHLELDKLINRSMRSHNRFAVLFLDLDGFKKINDELGHDAGDAFLKQIAARFKVEIRSFDIAARYGGDEFVIVLADIEDSIALSNKLQSIITSVSKDIIWKDGVINAGVSIGVSIYPDHGETTSTLISCADSAMYLAKKVGKNTFRFYSTEMNTKLLRKILLEKKLKQAHIQNELTLHYQPIVDVQTGITVAAEALLRWHSPELGSVSPEEFIQVAEGNGFINELGLWVLASAMSFAEKHPDLKISINASALQFNNDQLFLEIKRLSNSGELSNNNLCIEITERLLLEETERVNKMLHEIRNLVPHLTANNDTNFSYAHIQHL
ncbi:MAG: diguanylate cyclase [Shewanella sp.]|nr:diguanylate cyclase [Shewanella sp.]